MEINKPKGIFLLMLAIICLVAMCLTGGYLIIHFFQHEWWQISLLFAAILVYLFAMSILLVYGLDYLGIR
ncbi:MAG: hypothetical protein J6R47_06590 [Acholeplasmatales bacterium]|nr:hypothetical protein [Acholeplasmatales bacterium]